MASIESAIPLGAAPVPVCLTADDVTELAVMDAFHQFEVLRLPSLLRPHYYGQPLLICQLRRSHQRAYADRVHRTGFLHEDMLAGLERPRAPL